MEERLDRLGDLDVGTQLCGLVELEASLLGLGTVLSQ